MKKFIKQITFQHKLVDVINKGTEAEQAIDLVPENRVIVRYMEGEEADLIIEDALVETTDIDESSILIKKSDMNKENPDNIDLSNVGSQVLLEELLKKLEGYINK